MFKSQSIAAIVAMLAATVLPTDSRAANSVKVGVLACKLSPRVGLIVGSRQKISCRFTPDQGGPQELYVGTIGRLGLDLGVTAGGAMVWAVFAPTSGYHHGALAGTYAGVSGDVSLGLGVGAKALVGGSHRSIALQPLSVEGTVGVNVALSVSRLRLQLAH